MERKYRFLPFAAKVLKIVGWIVLVVGIIGSILSSVVFGVTVGGVEGFFLAVVGVIFSFLAWVFLLAASELFYLFMDVEENTRITAERIKKESI